MNHEKIFAEENKSRVCISMVDNLNQVEFLLTMCRDKLSIVIVQLIYHCIQAEGNARKEYKMVLPIPLKANKMQMVIEFTSTKNHKQTEHKKHCNMKI